MGTAYAIIQNHRGLAADWTGNDPTLLAGEVGIETDTGKIKIGNGTSTWTELDYFMDPVGIQGYGPDGMVTLSANAASALYTVMSDATSMLSANIYGWDDVSSTWNRVRLDPVDNNLISMEEVHHKIHTGDTYVITASADSVGDGVNLTLILSSGAASSVHVANVDVFSSNAAWYSVYEGVTLSAGPVSRAIYNRNRQSAKVATCAASSYSNAQRGFSEGTQLSRMAVGAKGAGGGLHDSEWILAKSTVYVFMITADSASTNLGIQLDLYENEK